MSKLIEPFLMRLLKSEPFYSAISRKIPKHENEGIPTAQVSVKKGGSIQMEYNPKFFRAILEDYKDDNPVEKVIGVIKHEFLHIVFNHITDRFTHRSDEDRQKWMNTATDLAINSFLKGELPERGCIPGEGVFVEFPEKESAEFYFKLIRNLDQDTRDKLMDAYNNQCIDIHDWMKGLSDTQQDMAEQKIEEILDEAGQHARARGWGSVPQEVQDIVNAHLNRSSISWRKVLRRFIQRILSEDRFCTPRRKNRRYPDVHPGWQNDTRTEVAVSIDQSGSMADEELAAFAGELNHLAEYIDFTVIPFDTDFSEDEIYTWEKGQKVHEFERVRSGGTDIDPVVRWVNNQKQYNGHIIFSDMQASEPRKSAVPRFWIVPEDGHPSFEVPGEPQVTISVDE